MIKVFWFFVLAVDLILGVMIFNQFFTLTKLDADNAGSQIRLDFCERNLRYEKEHVKDLLDILNHKN